MIPYTAYINTEKFAFAWPNVGLASPLHIVMFCWIMRRDLFQYIKMIPLLISFRLSTWDHIEKLLYRNSSRLKFTTPVITEILTVWSSLIAVFLDHLCVHIHSFLLDWIATTMKNINELFRNHFCFKTTIRKRVHIVQLPNEGISGFPETIRGFKHDVFGLNWAAR